MASKAAGGKMLICGTNSYKPLCRHYHPSPQDGGRLRKKEEFEGTGICPYDPEHNSTAIYAGLYTMFIFLFF